MVELAGSVVASQAAVGTTASTYYFVAKPLELESFLKLLRIAQWECAALLTVH